MAKQLPDTMQIAPGVQKQWERFKSEGKPGLMETFSMNITELDRGLVKATMPVSDTVKQPFGLMHGGASVVLAETLASLGSWLLIDPESHHVAGLEINANHLNPVSQGSVHAVATLLHKGRHTHVWQIRITDDQNYPVCISRSTIAVIPRKAAAGKAVKQV